MSLAYGKVVAAANVVERHDFPGTMGRFFALGPLGWLPAQLVIQSQGVISGSFHGNQIQQLDPALIKSQNIPSPYRGPSRRLILEYTKLCYENVMPITSQSPAEKTSPFGTFRAGAD